MTRDEILRRFEVVLDAALADETAPSGIPAELLGEGNGAGNDGESSCDSYMLWSATTALTQEVRLQGRAFQDLTSGLEAQAARIGAELKSVYAEREKLLKAEAERRARKQILGQMVDLRDRLVRGLESAKTCLETAKVPPPAPGFLERWLGSVPRADNPALDAVAALIRGSELGIERLDQSLEEFGALEIHCAGQMFDPRRMNAIETEVSTAVPEGTVLEVYRSGYEWEGEVFRTAQVKVAKGGNG